MRIQDLTPANARHYLLIAEVKTTSPFGWRSGGTWDELFALAARVGDVISVHTDPRWEGSVELVAKARALTPKPILAKGIHADDIQIRAALAAGADFALVVGRLPAADLLPRCLVEPNTVAELAQLPPETAAVWNSRDLRNGGLKPETFGSARAAWGGWLCQASNVGGPGDVEPSASAVLVGTALPTFARKLGFD